MTFLVSKATIAGGMHSQRRERRHGRQDQQKLQPAVRTRNSRKVGFVLAGDARKL